ncbi:MAG: methylmalonyl Co-A mutase-associated GTPase MeaB, partial [Acidobacteria bacterium]|nr:methylmalonyl Co-A mutase-associated GTPase MeaB [Acidobacteriota bacterium]
MSDARAAADLAERVLGGETAAVARAISWAERGDERFGGVLDAIHPKTGRARVTGLTGAPGA